LEVLNDRFNPATFTPQTVGETLVINQKTNAIGGIVITDDPASDLVTVQDTGDSSNIFQLNGLKNLVINLKPGDTSLVTYDIVSTRSGSVTLNLKNTAQRVLFLEGGAPIHGNLTVIGGNGALVASEQLDALNIGGNLTIRGGASLDSLDLSVVPGASIGGNLVVAKLNDLFLDSAAIDGSLKFNDAGEANDNVLELKNSHVFGNLAYVGGAGSEDVDFEGTTPRVDGNVTVAFGNQLATDTSFFVQPAGSTSVIGGNVKVTGSNRGTDDVDVFGVIAGKIQINLGNGTNNAAILGTIQGPTVNYTGGSGVDTVTYDVVAGSAAARFTAHLGAGNDTMTFGNSVAENPASAVVDFGAGIDALLGTIDFPCKTLHLP
jgi:hypothetical protein